MYQENQPPSIKRIYLKIKEIEAIKNRLRQKMLPFLKKSIDKWWRNRYIIIVD